MLVVNGVIMQTLGVLFATMAAFLNSTSGIITRQLIALGYYPMAIAIVKCNIAVLLLSLFLLFKRFRPTYRVSFPYLINSAICSFFGIFTLFYFETKAYALLTAPVVVFILIGSSAITTFLLGTFFQKERKSTKQIIYISTAMIGMTIIVLNQINFEPRGVIFASVSGVGYGLYLVFARYFRIKSDIFTLWLIIGFGVIFLYISSPSEVVILNNLNTSSLISFVLLALLPTLGGFFCTTKALRYSDSSEVQLIELSEPIFSVILSVLILLEGIQLKDFLGAVLILSSIYLYHRESNKQSI